MSLGPGSSGGSDSYLDRDHYDCIVVGSGFGGAVAACRLAQAGLDVALLERGRRWAPGSFPRDISHLSDGWLWQHRHGLFDLRPIADVACVRAAGYGGGSLVYANVAMRPRPEVFEQAWPEPYRRPELDRYYDLAAHMLQITPVANTADGDLPPKTLLMQQVADRLGDAAPLFHPNLAIRFADDDAQPGINPFGVRQGTCVHCGQCDIGCNVGAKNTLDLNYLALAERHGAQVATLTEATHLGRADGRYEVHLHQHADGGTRRRVTADTVFLCAGALGSTELLLRSRDQYATLPNLPASLGDGYSANGDFLAFGDGTADMVSPGTGPTITTAYAARTADGDEFVVEDGGYSAELAALVRRLHPLHAASLAARGTRSATGHDMVLLAMGRDSSNGRISLTEPNHHLHVEWDTEENRGLYEAQERVCADIVHALGGHASETPLWRYLGLPVSVHNLGGARMSPDPERGVVDTDGQVHRHPGLYVLDGAILPAATGVNPSHTITAVAERCIETAIRRMTGRPDWVAPEMASAGHVRVPEDEVPSASLLPRAPMARGVRFHEQMTGTIALTGAQARGRAVDARVELAVTIVNLRRFRRDPHHVADVSGLVFLAPITPGHGAPLKGDLQLLARTGITRRRTMTYRLWFSAADGQRWEIRGHKDVWPRHGPHIWKATTTLHTTLHLLDGDLRSTSSTPLRDEPHGTGTLRLSPLAFLRELASMRATGTTSVPASLATVATFFCFFLSRLGGAYTPHLGRPRRGGNGGRPWT